MSFWLRKAIFGIILAGLAIALMQNIDVFFELTGGSDDSAETTVEQIVPEQQKPEETVPPKPPELQKKKPETRRINSGNKAAKGLSDFYASISPDMDGDGPKIIKNVVYLPDPKGDLVKLLEAKRMTTRPLRPSWRGTKENRPFRTGETLFQKLYDYAEQDGLEVIWWLNRDLVIKDPFRINHGILKTALQVGQAMYGHFPGGVSTYFCNKQRALVLIEEPMPYLDRECILLEPTPY